MSDDVTVRAATPADLTGVLGVLDAAALETDADRVRSSVERGDGFVAVRGGSGGAGSATVLGALVLVDGETETADTARIDAVAVRRRQRGRGVGTALVAAAAEAHDRLVAEFDAGVRPFYESLDFEIEPVGDGESRYRGALDVSETP